MIYFQKPSFRLRRPCQGDADQNNDRVLRQRGRPKRRKQTSRLISVQLNKTVYKS